MLASQMHLAFTHFPIAGVFFSFLFTLLLIYKKHEYFKTVSSIILLSSGLTMVPVYFSGDTTSREVSRKPMVSRYNIQLHEESAERSFIGMMILTCVAAGFLLVQKNNNKYAMVVYILQVCLNLLLIVSLYDTAHKGGSIRHDQFRIGNGRGFGGMQ